MNKPFYVPEGVIPYLVEELDCETLRNLRLASRYYASFTFYLISKSRHRLLIRAKNRQKTPPRYYYYQSIKITKK